MVSKKHYIYKTTCIPTGKYYIGMHSTNNLEDGYMGSGIYLKRSIKSYGKESHTVEILEFHNTRQELSNREAELITKDLIKDRLCMNIGSGGIGGDNWNCKKRKPLSEEHKRKIGEANRGKKRSEATKYKISETKKGNKNIEHLSELTESNKKPIIQLELCGNLVREWGSTAEVVREGCFNRSGISACLRGKTKSSGGFKWKFKK